LIIGTRGSNLAVFQTQMVVDGLRNVAPDLDVEIVKVKTTGDDVRDRPLKSFGGIGAFTKELDSKIMAGEIDAAVNSLKDMPVDLTEGTMIAAVIRRGPSEDVLVSETPLESLPQGAIIGTSSVRRAALIKRVRPDLLTKDIRGNVPTRIRKMREGEYDAIILAKAGIERLGLDVSYFVLDPARFVPSAGQGAIAVVCSTKSPFREILGRLDDPPTREEVEAERTVLEALGGGCYLPIGINARHEGGQLRVRANILEERGERAIEDEIALDSGAERDRLRRFAENLKRRWTEARPASEDEGEVFLVGAGPGDAELITVKGARLLREADVVVHDALVASGILKELSPQVKLVDVGKRGKHHKAEQDEINEALLNEARAGKKVVRLKGGDPFLFGRGGEEAEFLRDRGVKVHLVPGVTSAIAAPAMAGIPVTHRGLASQVTFVTGHESAGKKKETVDWASLAKLDGTIVILMGMSNLAHNMTSLVAGGLNPETPVAVIEKGSTDEQKTVVATVANVAEACGAQGIGSPAVVVVGNVARMRKVLGDLG